MMSKQNRKSNLTDWLCTPQGRYVLEWEQTQMDNAVDDVFGFNAVQLGVPEVDFLRKNRMPLKIRAGREVGATVNADATQLPFASQSVDLLLLPHLLEFSDHPHQILREGERVLMPEGRIVISGFNPLSMWGMKRAFNRCDFPWRGRFIGVARLKDWLALLGFELNGGRFGCYAPPFTQARLLARSRFLEKAGGRWWPIAGGAYVVRAVKRNVGLRLVTPAWREARAKRPVMVQVARRDNVIHVRRNER